MKKLESHCDHGMHHDEWGHARAEDTYLLRALDNTCFCHFNCIGIQLSRRCVSLSQNWLGVSLGKSNLESASRFLPHFSAAPYAYSNQNKIILAHSLCNVAKLCTGPAHDCVDYDQLPLSWSHSTSPLFNSTADSSGVVLSGDPLCSYISIRA